MAGSKSNRNQRVTLDINDFSKHLFWDVDKQALSASQNKSFVVRRVLEYGVLKDWQILKKEIGIKEITEVAVNLRNLDNKTLSFISFISKIPKEDFICYTMKPSSPQHWNF